MAKKNTKSPSVRSSITSIEGGLSNLTNALMQENNTFVSILDIQETMAEEQRNLLRSVNKNIQQLSEAILGFDPNKNKSRVLEPQTGEVKEDKREKDKDEEKQAKKMDEMAKATKMSAEELKKLSGILKGGSFLDILILGGTVLAGFVAGVVDAIIGTFKGAMKVVEKFKTVLGINTSAIGKIVDSVSKGFGSFVKVFKGISDFIMKFSGLKAMMDVINNGTMKVISFVTTSTKAFFASLKTFSDTISFFTGKVGMIGKLFEYFTNMFKVISPIFNAARTFGSTIFKVVPLIGAVISIFDAVVGAFKGFTETQGSIVDKFIGGLKGGITGLINAMFGGLLDLLKGGVSWIVKSLFGDNAVSKALDSFSFKDVISSAVGSIIEYLMTPFRVAQDLVKTMSGEMSLGEFFKSLFARIVSAVLTPIELVVKGITGVFGKSFSITDEALSLLGLPKPQQGGTVSSTSSTGTPTKALEKTTDENLAAKDEQTAKNTGTTIAMNTNNSPVINNNTQSTAIIKAKTTNWEPDDQYARGGMAWGA